MDISHVYKEVEKEIDLLNAKLANEANCQYELVQDIVQHIIHKGKRIRPVLLILLAKAFEINNFDAIINSAFMSLKFLVMYLNVPSLFFPK